MTQSLPGSPPVLPNWAEASVKRRGHIARVTHLLDEWSDALSLGSEERQNWHDAGRLHDALRDADESELRKLTGDYSSPVGLLHGPAAADRLSVEGSFSKNVIDAIRWHTVGYSAWEMTGKALYMADFLEPGRSFMQADRAFLANLVPRGFDAVFRQVVRLRMEWALREGKSLSYSTVELWNMVR